MSETNPNQVKNTPGRNDPCPCGSGKKYKKCCMGKLESGGRSSHKTDVEKLLDEATTLFECGQLDIAKTVAHEVLAITPDNADANHILGGIELARGNLDLAEPMLIKAAKFAKNNSHIQLNLAKLYELKKEFDTALSFIKLSEKLAPDLVDVKNTYGNILLKMGEAEKALHYYEKAIRLEPSNPDYLLGYYAALHKTSRIDEARSGYQDLIKNYPSYISSYINLAAIYRDQGDIKQGIELLQKAARIQPLNAELHANLGTLFGRMGEFEKEVDFYKHALSLNPGALNIYRNLMDALREQNRFAELYELAKKIVDSTELKTLLGRAIIAFGAVGAVDERKNAVGSWLQAIGTSISPEDLQLLLLTTNELDYLDSEIIYSLHRNWGKQLESKIRPFKHGKDHCKEARIKVGYVSPDFRNHPVGIFIRNSLRHSNTNAFDIYCYSNADTEDEITGEIKKFVTNFKKIGSLGHREVAEQIREDQIDILVDLAGHTHKSRLPAFAYKPAPIQITYLGYPNTTGLKTMDYRITDRYADVDAGTKYTEKLVFMPESFLSFGSFAAVPIVDRFAFEDNGYVTYGSFNNIRKLNRKTIEVWSAILLKDLKNKLVLKADGLEHEVVRNNIYSLFFDYGIAKDRLELVGSIADDQEHLAAYNKIDIALDTFPYNGTTTTCEALWMGVPVISLLGQLHAQRVSYSILKNIGVENTIAKTRDEYIDLATELANSPGELLRLKRSLREKMQNSILCDSGRFTRQLEDLYRQLWQHYCEDKI